ncbi:MAG: intradiol ring-cleavage dioxygenase, partial [Anaerolineae bacterium]|nr:intradiol ring-cleavage dioxygenase [Anaerolineae bacterium]
MEAHDDDKPVGRVLTRREVLVLLGSAGAAAAVVGTGFTRVFAQEATAEATEAVTPSCVVRPEMTEGPYFVDEMLNRSDIRIEPSDGSIKEGQLLYLTINVMDVTGGACAPLEGAQVDIWHCDAQGVYSDVQDAGFNTVGQKWLRGYQITDANGQVKFTTIYPGWDSGRAVHIHFKIRVNVGTSSAYEFTSQFFFDDALSDDVFTQTPYSGKGQRNTLNRNDSIYADGGDQMVLQLVKGDDGSYSTTYSVGLDLSDEAV